MENPFNIKTELNYLSNMVEMAFQVQVPTNYIQIHFTIDPDIPEKESFPMPKWKKSAASNPNYEALMNNLDWLIENHYLDSRFGSIPDDLELADEIVEDTDVWNRIPASALPGTTRSFMRACLAEMRA